MKIGPTYNVPFRRKREQKTDYNKRLKFLKSEQKRFIVRVSNTLVRAQIIDYKIDGDLTLLSVTSKSLRKYDWKFSLKSTPAIYLTGFLIGTLLKEKNINKVIFDTGVKNYKSRSKIYAALKGIVDAGIECPHDPKAFPDADRIEGKHIDDFKKNNINKNFLEVKEKIISKK
jgi:large subunit ribosomal protein L18